MTLHKRTLQHGKMVVAALLLCLGLFAGTSRARTIKALPIGGMHVAEAMLAGAQAGSPAGPTYFYVVTTVDVNGFQSAFSSQVAASFGQGKHITDLSWTAATIPSGGAAIAGYNVWRGTVSGGPYTQINSALVTGVTYADIFVLPNAVSGLAATIN